MLLSSCLKEAIRSSGKTVAEIAREVGIPRPNLSRFLSDDPEKHRDIRLETTADKLASYFGLALAPAENEAKDRTIKPAVSIKRSTQGKKSRN